MKNEEAYVLVRMGHFKRGRAFGLVSKFEKAQENRLGRITLATMSDNREPFSIDIRFGPKDGDRLQASLGDVKAGDAIDFHIYCDYSERHNLVMFFMEGAERWEKRATPEFRETVAPLLAA